MLDSFLKAFVRYGVCTIIDPGGAAHTAAGPLPGPAVTIRIDDWSFAWKLALDPTGTVGCAYMNGTLHVEQGTLYDFLELAAINMHARDQRPTPGQRLARWLEARAATLDQFNPIEASGRKVRHHYDLNSRLFDLFLDINRQYSCGYFLSPDDDLETAQRRKMRHIAAKLLLRPGMKVLDIGSGWGGLAFYLARHFDVEVTGLTLSREQHAASLERARDLGLEGRTTFRLEDYRQTTGRYDRIVSVGMFEHVGRRHYGEFFSKIKELLADDGVALLHSISVYANRGPINRWIREHIFPGAYLPTLSEVLPALEHRYLWITDIEILRNHYADTLRAWNRNFQANRDAARALYDERFCRMWEFYLQGCEVSFRHLSTMVFQLQIAKDRGAVPLIRDYMVDTERALAATDRAAAAIAVDDDLGEQRKRRSA